MSAAGGGGTGAATGAATGAGLGAATGAGRAAGGSGANDGGALAVRTGFGVTRATLSWYELFIVRNAMSGFLVPANSFPAAAVSTHDARSARSASMVPSASTLLDPTTTTANGPSSGT